MSESTTPGAPTAGGATSTDGAATPMLHHVNLKTTRLQEMIDFYGLATGMRPNFRNEIIAFLSNDSANHRIALLGIPGLSDDPDQISHTGLHHTAFEFPEIGDLLTRYQTLKEAGHEPYVCLDHGLTLSFYYADPDGNNLELQIDNFGNWAESTEWIRTATEFVEDPIGKFVDPDEILEAWRQGADRAEIHRRAFNGEFPSKIEPDLRLP